MDCLLILLGAEGEPTNAAEKVGKGFGRTGKTGLLGGNQGAYWFRLEYEPPQP